MADPKLQKEVDKLVQEEMSTRAQKEVDTELKEMGIIPQPSKGVQGNGATKAHGVPDSSKHGAKSPAAPSKESETQGEEPGYSYGMGQ